MNRNLWRAQLSKKLKAFLVTAAMVLGLGVSTAIVATPASALTSLCSGSNYSTCTGAGYTDHGYSANSSTSYWGAYAGHNCTNYVAYVESTVNGAPSPGNNLGDAKDWGPNAAAKGISVNGDPKKGSVAWWDGNSVMGSSGHVAYVEEMLPNGAIKLSDDSYSAGPFRWYTLSPGDPAWPTNFIHFKDIDQNPGNPTHSTTILRTKKAIAADGSQEVYSATSSDVFESWWVPGGNGVHTSSIITIGQNNIVDMDKIQLPNGTHSLYTAVPDGIWETYWNASTGPRNAKIIEGLSGVKRVIASTRTESNGQLTHLLYVLAADGPYEYWWRDGGDGIHSAHLASINNPVAFVWNVTPNGRNEVYTATAGAVYRTKWYPGQSTPTETDTLIGISQNNIADIDEVTVNGTYKLYTATTTGVWRTQWTESNATPTNDLYVNNQSGGRAINARLASNGTEMLFLATGDHVQWYWKGTDGVTGGGTLISISQNNITDMDVPRDGSVGPVYIGAGGKAWETWLDGSLNPHSGVLAQLD